MNFFSQLFFSLVQLRNNIEEDKNPLIIFISDSNPSTKYNKKPNNYTPPINLTINLNNPEYDNEIEKREDKLSSSLDILLKHEKQKSPVEQFKKELKIKQNEEFNLDSIDDYIKNDAYLDYETEVNGMDMPYKYIVDHSYPDDEQLLNDRGLFYKGFLGSRPYSPPQPYTKEQLLDRLKSITRYSDINKRLSGIKDVNLRMKRNIQRNYSPAAFCSNCPGSRRRMYG